jgi:hypothetical protein
MSRSSAGILDNYPEKMFRLIVLSLTVMACFVQAIDLSRLYGLHDKREGNLMGNYQ